MDLTVSDEYIIGKPFSGLGHVLDPKSQESIDSVFGETQKLPLELRPKSCVLLSTKETVCIPSGWLGHICLRSTFARLGLLAPPTVADPDFIGTLTLEVYNASENSVLIESGIAMWSLHYIRAANADPYVGRYQNQYGVTGPKAIT